MNRILLSFARMEAQIKDRIAKGHTTKEKVDEVAKTLDMDFQEFVRFQELKSLAVATEKLTLDEGMTIFNALGGTPSHFNAQPTHIKSVMTSLFAELLLLTNPKLANNLGKQAA